MDKSVMVKAKVLSLKLSSAVIATDSAIKYEQDKGNKNQLLKPGIVKVFWTSRQTHSPNLVKPRNNCKNWNKLETFH